MKLCFWNSDLICASDQPYDVKLPGHVWLDAPNDYSSDKVYKLEDGSIVEKTILQHDPKRLRIYRVVPLYYNHEYVKNLIDFSILGFRKISPQKDRGRKVLSEYKCIDKDELIVDKTFTDVRETATGRLTDIQMHVKWYCEDGTIGMEKIEKVRSFTKTDAETEERKRRERAVDFLVSEGRNTAIEPVMDALFSFFHTEQLLYKEKGNDLFKNAINGVDPSLNTEMATIDSYLNIRVPTYSNPEFSTTIKNAILYQIHAIDDATFMAGLLPVES